MDSETTEEVAKEKSDKKQVAKEKSDKKRRSSILKTPKARNPLEELDVTETEQKVTRRVSFASSNFIKPFVADPEKNTIWDTTYEEDVNHTNSTQSSQGQASNLVTKMSSTLFESSVQATATNTNSTWYNQSMELTSIVHKENTVPQRFSIVDYARKMSAGCQKSNSSCHLPRTSFLSKTFADLEGQRMQDNSAVKRSVEMELTLQDEFVKKSRTQPGDLEFTCQEMSKTSLETHDDMEFTCHLSKTQADVKLQLTHHMDLTCNNSENTQVNDNMEFTCHMSKIEKNVNFNPVFSMCQSGKENMKISSQSNVGGDITDSDNMQIASRLPTEILSSTKSHNMQPNVSDNMEITCQIPKENLPTTKSDHMEPIIGCENNEDMEFTCQIINSNLKKNMDFGCQISKENVTIAASDNMELTGDNDNMEFTCQIPKSNVKNSDNLEMACQIPKENVSITSSDNMELTIDNDNMEFTCQVPKSNVKISDNLEIASQISKENFTTTTTDNIERNVGPEDTDNMEFTCQISKSSVNISDDLEIALQIPEEKIATTKSDMEVNAAPESNDNMEFTCQFTSVKTLDNMGIDCQIPRKNVTITINDDPEDINKIEFTCQLPNSSVKISDNLEIACQISEEKDNMEVNVVPEGNDNMQFTCQIPKEDVHILAKDNLEPSVNPQINDTMEFTCQTNKTHLIDAKNIDRKLTYVPKNILDITTSDNNDITNGNMEFTCQVPNNIELKTCPEMKKINNARHMDIDNPLGCQLQPNGDVESSQRRVESINLNESLQLSRKSSTDSVKNYSHINTQDMLRLSDLDRALGSNEHSIDEDFKPKVLKGDFKNIYIDEENIDVQHNDINRSLSPKAKDIGNISKINVSLEDKSFKPRVNTSVAILNHCSNSSFQPENSNILKTCTNVTNNSIDSQMEVQKTLPLQSEKVNDTMENKRMQDQSLDAEVNDSCQMEIDTSLPLQSNKTIDAVADQSLKCKDVNAHSIDKLLKPLTQYDNNLSNYSNMDIDMTLHCQNKSHHDVVKNKIMKNMTFKSRDANDSLCFQINKTNDIPAKKCQDLNDSLKCQENLLTTYKDNELSGIMSFDSNMEMEKSLLATNENLHCAVTKKEKDEVSSLCNTVDFENDSVKAKGVDHDQSSQNLKSFLDTQFTNVNNSHMEITRTDESFACHIPRSISNLTPKKSLPISRTPLRTPEFKSKKFVKANDNSKIPVATPSKNAATNCENNTSFPISFANSSGVDDTAHLLDYEFSNANRDSNLELSNCSKFEETFGLPDLPKEETPDRSLYDTRCVNKLSHINDTYVLTKKKRVKNEEERDVFVHETSNSDEDGSVGIISDASVLLDEEVKMNVKDRFVNVQVRNVDLSIKNMDEINQLLAKIERDRLYTENFLEIFEVRPIRIPEKFVVDVNVEDATSNEEREEVIEEVSLEEKIRKHQESCQKCWTLERVEEAKFQFSTLFGTLIFIVQLELDTGLVMDVQKINKLSVNAKPLAHFIMNQFLDKLSDNHIMAAIKDHYDVLSLLDYVHMTMLELKTFENDFTYRCRLFKMEENFMVRCRMVSVRMVWHSDILINVKELNNFKVDEDIKIINHVGTVNENEIKKLIRNCSFGLQFLPQLHESIEEYIRKKEQRKK